MNCAPISTSDPRAASVPMASERAPDFWPDALSCREPEPTPDQVRRRLSLEAPQNEQYLPRRRLLKIKRHRSCQFPGTLFIFAKSYAFPLMYRRGWILSEPYGRPVHPVIPKVEP